MSHIGGFLVVGVGSSSTRMTRTLSARATSGRGGNSFLLSAILQQTTGMNALAFAQQNLFGPLGIADVYWPANPDGISHGWGNMHLKPHDLAKIGYLYLDGGRWEGEQIIPADWVEASTRIHIETVRTDGLSEGYGYQWWIDDGGYWAVRGTGGQFIFVVPHLNLVAVFTGELSDTLYPAPDRLLNEYIIPAAE